MIRKLKSITWALFPFKKHWLYRTLVVRPRKKMMKKLLADGVEAYNEALRERLEEVEADLNQFSGWRR